MKYREKPIKSIPQTFEGHLSQERFNMGMQYIFIEYGRLLLVAVYVKIEFSTRGTNSNPFLVFRRIICCTHQGSFAVQFGDHFQFWDHLRSGIICGAVQFLNVINRKK